MLLVWVFYASGFDYRNTEKACLTCNVKADVLEGCLFQNRKAQRCHPFFANETKEIRSNRKFQMNLIILRKQSFVFMFSTIVSPTYMIAFSVDVLPGTRDTGVSLVPRLDGRIVGGSAVDISAYPYQLSFRYSNSHICGASIISANWALTAAHCASGLVLLKCV